MQEIFEEKKSESKEEDHDIKVDNVGGPSDADKQFMTGFREQLSKDMWEARGPRRV